LSERFGKDVDELILDALRSKGSLSPKDLEKACTSQGISRPTYFRHKKKLKELRQIEEIKRINTEGKSTKEFRYVGPYELAAQGEIEFYLAKIEDSNKEIRQRGIHFFCLLTKQRRVAWYFSPQFSPKFKEHRDVSEFFGNKLLKGPINVRLQFSNALENMLKLEGDSSLWRMDLIKSCQKILKEIALKEKNIEMRREGIRILRSIPDIALIDLGFHILEEPISDKDFDFLLQILKEILIESKEAKTKKLMIREELDRLSIKTVALAGRVRALLEGASP